HRVAGAHLPRRLALRAARRAALSPHRRTVDRPRQRRAADARLDRADVGPPAAASRPHRCMRSPLDWVARPETGHVVLAPALAVTAGYQIRRPMEITARAPFLASCFRGFWGEESGYRWSQASSTVVFPDPGAGANARLELDVSGWRPRGEATPFLNITAGSAGLDARPSPRGGTPSPAVPTHGLL